MRESVELRLERKGILLPGSSAPLANYASAVLSGNLLFLSGRGPRDHDGSWLRGKLGDTLTINDGYGHARLVGLSLLAAAKAALGSLDRIERVVKVLGFVNATRDFSGHPRVIDGCSDLLVEVFDDAGKHARSAVGVVSLPEGISVEIEAIFKIR